MAKQEVIKPSTVPAVQRIDIQSFTVDTLKFGPINIQVMSENTAKAAEKMGKDTPKGKVCEAQSIAFGQVANAFTPEETPAPNDLARAGIVVRKTAGWYREAERNLSTADMHKIDRIWNETPEDKAAILGAKAAAFAESLKILGQESVVEQINSEIRAEKTSTT